MAETQDLGKAGTCCHCGDTRTNLGACPRACHGLHCNHWYLSGTGKQKERGEPCPGCDGHECDEACQYPKRQTTEERKDG